MFASLFLILLGLCCCSTESILGRPQLFGNSEALVKTVVEIQCELLEYPENETILLQFFKKGNRDWLLGEYTSLNGEIGVIPLIVKRKHEGNLECVAKAQNNSNIEPTVSSPHYLKVIEPVKGAELSGPEEIFEGMTLNLSCTVSAGNHVSYRWLLNGQHQPHFHDAHLFINRATSKDSGSYTCVATNQFNHTVFTSRSSVAITVKDVVLSPHISFTVLKEGFNKYIAVVTCESMKGTLPVTFSLYNMKDLVENVTVEERKATFRVPLTLGQHLGYLQCRASNGDQIVNSEWVPLEVVPVGGPVTVDYNYDFGEDYALITLYCKAANGSFPRYQWFLNNTPLNDEGSFYQVVNQPRKQSILMVFVERNRAGSYQCEVSDSFDNTTAISSKRLYLNKEALERLPVYLVAVVFACFAAVVVLVSGCCCIGVVFRRRQYGEKSLSGVEMKRMVVYEGELDVSEYDEDADVAKMARGGEFDQHLTDTGSDSVDEWPQIEEEKKTLEDEAVEEL